MITPAVRGMDVLGCPSVFSMENIDMELPMVLCDHAPCKSGLPSGRRGMGPPLTSCGDTYGFPFNSGFTGPRPGPCAATGRASINSAAAIWILSAMLRILLIACGNRWSFFYRVAFVLHDLEILFSMK